MNGVEQDSHSSQTSSADALEDIAEYLEYSSSDEYLDYCDRVCGDPEDVRARLLARKPV